MNKKITLIGIGAGILWVLAASFDVFGWVGQGWAGGWGFLWYLYCAPAVALLYGVVVGVVIKEQKMKTGVSGFAVAIVTMILGFGLLSVVNQLRVQSAVRNVEKSDQEFWRQVEVNKSMIEQERWFDAEGYRFQYDKERWTLYIDDGDQKIFVRERPSRFAYGVDDIDMLGSYISIRVGEGELPVDGLDEEITINGQRAFVRKEMLDQGMSRKTYAIQISSDPFSFWWFSQYPYIEGSEDTKDFENMMRTVELK
jgi:hypothetical protein